MRYIMIISMVAILILASQRLWADGYAALKGGYVDARTNHTAVFVVGGYEWNEFIGIEGMSIVNSSNEGWNGKSVEVDGFWSLGITAGIDITDNIRPIINYGHAWIEIGDDKESSSYLSYGVEYHLLERWDIRLTYGEYSKGVDMASIGLKMNF